MQLEFQGVTKKFGALTALSSVSFAVQGGDTVGVVGPNGAGKTTLLRLAALLSKPSLGEILVDGLSLKKNYSRGVGFVSTQSYLYEDLTVAENLKLYSKLYGTLDSKWEINSKLLNIDSILYKIVKELSHGQKRCVALIRGLLHGPRIVLFDEPFLGLDKENSLQLVKLIREFKKEGRIVLVATHHLELMGDLVNRLVTLNHGQIVREGLGVN